MAIWARPLTFILLGFGLAVGLAACAGRSADELPQVAASTTVGTPDQPRATEAAAPSTTTLPSASDSPTEAPPEIIVHALGSYDRLSDPSAAGAPRNPLFDEDLATTAFLGCTPGTPDCGVEGIQTLVASGIDVISVATPAADDSGAQALADFVSVLRDNGMAVVGFGQSTAEAIAPSLFNAGVGGIAFHAISLVEDSSPSARATATSAGISSLETVDRLLAAIAESVDANFEVVVLVSWGSPDDRAPLDSQVVFTQLLIDAGASAVIGNVPRLQRFDLVGTTPVIYSLGTAAASDGDPAQVDTAIARLAFSQTETSCLIAATSSPLGVVVDDPTRQSCP